MDFIEQKCILNSLKWGQSVQLSTGCQSSRPAAQARDVGRGGEAEAVTSAGTENQETGISQSNGVETRGRRGAPSIGRQLPF
jgi:hypothetical protein